MNAMFFGLPLLYWLCLAIALVVSAIGFYRVVYFVSLGYGFSIAAMAAAAFTFSWQGMTLALALQALVLLIYGLRLGLFLLYREYQDSFRSDKEETERRYKVRNPLVILAIWLSVSILYASMFSPFVFHAESSAFAGPLVWLGLGIALLGIVMESAADFHKTRFKKKQPNQFVSSGLYKFVRQPNYFGEILVWTGNFIAGIPFYASALWWVIASVAYICIVLIMLGSAKRLENKQERRYGDRDDFRQYAAKTPLLFPFVPLYSLKNWRIVLG